MQRPFLSLVPGALAGAIAALAAGPALADKIKHPVAIFAGLDKITGRIISFEVNVDETVQFGSLHVTPRVCYTRPPTEAPHTTGFVEVEEVEKENQFKKIFSGWMFAASPGLSAAEHPVYDVWLTDCKGGTQIIKEVRAVEETPSDGRPIGAAPVTVSPNPRAQPGQQPGQQPPRGRQQPGQLQANQPLPTTLPTSPLAPAAQPRPGTPLPPAAIPGGGLVPPAAIPQQRAQEQRRAPTQSFFPQAPARQAPPSAQRDNTYTSN
jgi:hypothetical protein